MPRVSCCDINLRKIVVINEQPVLVEWEVDGPRNASGLYRWFVDVTWGQRTSRKPVQTSPMKVGLFMARLRFDQPEKMDFLWARIDEMLG